jgi:hypothetical protein
MKNTLIERIKVFSGKTRAEVVANYKRWRDFVNDEDTDIVYDFIIQGENNDFIGIAKYKG